jgi:hypothetical protein
MSTGTSKVICINPWPGGHVYVRTSERAWQALTKDARVAGNTVDGNELNPTLMHKIIMGDYSERETYQRIPVEIPSDRPDVDYWINYSSLKRQYEHRAIHRK